jgi:hypothetical protein
MPTKSTAARYLLNPGIGQFRSFLQSELQALQQGPVLIISSEASVDHLTHRPTGGSKTDSQPRHERLLKPVADACQFVQFTLSQQLGLRTVPTTISSAFPTFPDLEQRFELLRRTGATSVVAVGSGAAIDLAKALHAERSNSLERVILVPSTFGAVIASGSSHALFLDGIEETLVPMPKHQNDGNQTSLSDVGGGITVASLLDGKRYMESATDDLRDIDLLYGVSAILLDACYRDSQNPILPLLVDSAIDLLSVARSSGQHPSDDMNIRMNHLLYQSGCLLSYGLGNEDRSIPLALGSSLIPRLFPELHPISFLAGLVPGLCDILLKKQHKHYQPNEVATSLNNNNHSRLLMELLMHPQPLSSTSSPTTESSMRSTVPPPPPPLLTIQEESLQGFSVPDMALSHIQSNRSTCKALDVPDSVLIDILQRSIVSSSSSSSSGRK